MSPSRIHLAFVVLIGSFCFGQTTYDYDIYKKGELSLPYRILLPKNFQKDKNIPFWFFFTGLENVA